MRTSYGALTAVWVPIKEIADVPICGFFRWLSLFALVLIFPVCGGVVWAQADAVPTVISKRIAVEYTPDWHATDEQLGKLWGHLATDYHHEMDVHGAKDAYNHALRLLRGAPAAQSRMLRHSTGAARCIW